MAKWARGKVWVRSKIGSRRICALGPRNDWTPGALPWIVYVARLIPVHLVWIKENHKACAMGHGVSIQRFHSAFPLNRPKVIGLCSGRATRMWGRPIPFQKGASGPSMLFNVGHQGNHSCPPKWRTLGGPTKRNPPVIQPPEFSSTLERT